MSKQLYNLQSINSGSFVLFEKQNVIIHDLSSKLDRRCNYMFQSYYVRNNTNYTENIIDYDNNNNDADD